MSEHFAVRNISTQPLTIKVVERFATLEDSLLVSRLSNVTSLFRNATFTGKAKLPSPMQLAEKARSFTKANVDLRLEPFRTLRTEILDLRNTDKVLRVTLQDDDGARWRLNLPTPGAALLPLTSLTPGAEKSYNAIFNAETLFLTLCESPKLEDWMSRFPDDTFISALSIPGTHNSPTCHKALPSVRCQAVSPLEQLSNGVRFFDVRVQPDHPGDPSSDSLTLVHAAFPVSLAGSKKFRPFLDEILSFLRSNPSETVIMSLKREGIGSATDAHLATILRTHYTSSSPHWYTSSHIPRLGAVRGKIVLLRRFSLPTLSSNDPPSYALNAECWADNTTNDIHGDVHVQDFYEVLATQNIRKKISLCCDHFARAAAAVTPIPGVTTDAINPVPPGPLFLNFLSASNFWKAGCWPDKIAKKINPAIVKYLCEEHGTQGDGGEFSGDGGVGIVVCDWVGEKGDWDLVKCIIGMNGRLLLQKRQLDA